MTTIDWQVFGISPGEALLELTQKSRLLECKKL
jgi:hypothetical protein